MAEKLASIKKIVSGGFKTCTIVGTLTDTTYVQRADSSGSNWNSVYGATGSSTVKIVVDLEDGTYTISGNSTGATTGGTGYTSQWHFFRGTSSCSLSISSITFE